MFLRRSSIRVFAGPAAALLLLSSAFAQIAKRPLNHKDYDGWRSITGQRLSNDGKFLAYGVFPQEGDGEVIIRHLVTGKDTHVPAGARPLPPGTPASEEGPPPEPRGTTIVFSSDSKFVVFSTFPTKADTDKARKEKKTADQMPKDGMAIVELASAKVTTVDRVRRFAMPEKAAGYLVYQREAPEKPVASPAAPTGGGNVSTKSGYVFTYTGTQYTYSVTAAPASLNQTGVRYFYTDQSGVIHYAVGVAATSSSSPL
jgi:hypothetical protein